MRQAADELMRLVDEDADDVALLWRQRLAGQEERPQPRHQHGAQQPGCTRPKQATVEIDDDNAPPSKELCQVEAWLRLPQHGAQIGTQDELAQFVEHWRDLRRLRLRFLGVVGRPEGTGAQWIIRHLSQHPPAKSWIRQQGRQPQQRRLR